MSFQIDKKKKKISELFKDTSLLLTKDDFIRNDLLKHGDKIIVDLLLGDIEVRSQVRKEFDSENIKGLATDIEKNGLLHPVTVMKQPDNKDGYILVIGENRYLAFKKLKKARIPSIVRPFIENISDIKLLQLTENIQRKDLNPIELAYSIQLLKKELGLTNEKLGPLLGKSKDTIRKYCKIADLNQPEKDAFIQMKTGFKEIITHIYSKKAVSDTAFDSNREQLSLFSFATNKISLKKLSLNYKNESKESLEKKVAAIEIFLKEAKNRLKKITSG